MVRLDKFDTSLTESINIIQNIIQKMEQSLKQATGKIGKLVVRKLDNVLNKNIEFITLQNASVIL